MVARHGVGYPWRVSTPSNPGEVMSGTRDPVRNGIRAAILAAIMGAVLIFGSDFYLSGRVAERVAQAEAMVAAGACVEGRECALEGLQADECNAITGNVLLPTFEVDEVLERAQVEFVSRRRCRKGTNRVVFVPRAR